MQSVGFAVRNVLRVFRWTYCQGGNDRQVGYSIGCNSIQFDFAQMCVTIIWTSSDLIPASLSRPQAAITSPRCSHSYIQNIPAIEIMYWCWVASPLYCCLDAQCLIASSFGQWEPVRNVSLKASLGRQLALIAL